MNDKYPLKTRFKILAGITEDDTLATLYIPQSHTTIQLKKLPGWIDRLKYKLCGFEYTKIRNEPVPIESKHITEHSIWSEDSM